MKNEPEKHIVETDDMIVASAPTNPAPAVQLLSLCPCSTNAWLTYKYVPAPAAHPDDLLGSDYSDAQIERAARAISRAYVTGFRQGIENNSGAMQWDKTTDEVVEAQWHMFTLEAFDSLLPAPKPGQTHKTQINHEQ